jgi:Spy/CpxP family protein refolding chaperone
VYRRLLCLIFALAAAGTAAQTLPGPEASDEWWKSEPVRKELGLTRGQSMRIGRVFQAMQPKLLQERERLDQLEARLSHLITVNAGEAKVVRHVDLVETLRTSMRKERTVMLLHMRQVLTPEQREKMNAMHDRWTEEQKARQQAQQEQHQREASPQRQQQPPPSSDPRKRSGVSHPL